MSKVTEAICAEPKVFVGQLPMEATKDQVFNKFSQYGTVKKCNLVTGSDGRSKGCAMVLMDRWSEAEAIIDSFNGTDAFGGQRALVVKFADPPKSVDGSPSVGIAPKKLFVGQVPSGTTEEVLRELFGAYGVLHECHILQKGSGSGCAFVTYDKWAQCEAAIDAIDGKHKLPGAKTALVVRFANAKGTVAPGAGPPPKPGDKRVGGGDAGAAPSKRSFNGTPAPPTSTQSGYSGYTAPTAPGTYGGYTDMGMGAMSANMGYNPMMQGMMGNAMGMMPGMVGMGAGMGGMGMAGMAGMGGMGMMGMGGMGMNPMAMGNMPMGMGMGQMAAASPMGPMTNMNSLATMGAMGQMGGMAGMTNPMQQGAMAGNMGSAAAPAMANGKLGVGMTEEMKAWKLFVGQVPFEASEHDLWPIFSPMGEIAELVVLKNQQTNKSKGCAFVTYTSRMCAEQAIRLLDGKSSLPGRSDKTLVVKYANAK